MSELPVDERALHARVNEERQAIDLRLTRWLSTRAWSAARLRAATEYALLGGGKRLRAILCLWSSDALGGKRDEALWATALSLELVHTYSLVHDDLPAMDDDDLRRGRPSCHRAYDEATAILVGDVLQTEAFGLLATRVGGERGSALVRTLSGALGLDGMAAGQQLDLDFSQAEATAERLESIHRRKTGRLLGAALAMGAICAEAPHERVAMLQAAGEEAGVAFQIVDDILDEIGAREDLGKTAGKDREQGKLSATRLYGSVEAARAEAERRLELALEPLRAWGDDGASLRSLLWLLVHRER